MNWEHNQYHITDSKDELNMKFFIKSLQSTYWGEGRPSQLIKKSIENSVVLSLFDKDKQIGFARIVSDFACFSWLCDVYISPEYRRKGLGKFLMSCVAEHPASKVRMKILATKDAHGLYELYGYERKEMMFKKTEYEELL